MEQEPFSHGEARGPRSSESELQRGGYEGEGPTGFPEAIGEVLCAYVMCSCVWRSFFWPVTSLFDRASPHTYMYINIIMR